MPVPLLLWSGPAALLAALAEDLRIDHRRMHRLDVARRVSEKIWRIRLRLRELTASDAGFQLIHTALHGRREGQRLDAHWRFSDAVGADLIDMGMSRSALAVQRDYGGQTLPSFVVKITQDDHANYENYFEVQLWRWVVANKAADPRAAKLADLLVPIWLHAKDYSWIVLEYAGPVRAPEDWFETAYAIEDLGVGDQHEKNLGTHEGRVKSFDYAHLETDLIRDAIGIPVRLPLGVPAPEGSEDWPHWREEE